MIYVASDHGGFDLKNAVVELLGERDVVFTDFGAHDLDSVDYPDYAQRVAKAVAANSDEDLGILVCGTGIGMSISANKVPGIRAALVHDDFTAQMAKEHNNANILVMGGRILSIEDGKRLVEIWLDSEYEGGRHQNRLDKISAIEQRQIKE